MKTSTYIRLSLLFPYILWVVVAGFMAAASAVFPSSESIPILSGFITLSFVYTFGILLWGVPYTILALILWIWSRRKPARTMVKVFLFSPLVMALLAAIEVLLVLGRDGAVSPDFGGAALAVSGFAILYGYGIIGIVAGAYKLLRMRNFIEPEHEISPTELTLP